MLLYKETKKAKKNTFIIPSLWKVEGKFPLPVSRLVTSPSSSPLNQARVFISTKIHVRICDVPFNGYYPSLCISAPFLRIFAVGSNTFLFMLPPPPPFASFPPPPPSASHASPHRFQRHPPTACSGSTWFAPNTPRTAFLAAKFPAAPPGVTAET